jgi:glycogen debranching enzyme
MSYVTNHSFHIESNEWESLPEVTNDDGQFCEHSSPAQAWSVATLIEAIYESRRTYGEKKEEKK